MTSPILPRQRVYKTVPAVCEVCHVPFGARRNLPKGQGRFCSKSCRATWQNHFFRVPLEARFWEHVDKTGPLECWLWTSTIDRGGYGRIRAEGPGREMLLAHRVSCELHHGPISEGLMVLHTCDVRHCVNPSHLYEGTHLQNMTDEVRRGRSLTGERNHKAKLTAPDVIAIRRERAAGVLLPELAARYGITKTSVWQIVTGKHWKHLPWDDDRKKLEGK